MNVHPDDDAPPLLHRLLVLVRCPRDLVLDETTSIALTDPPMASILHLMPWMFGPDVSTSSVRVSMK